MFFFKMYACDSRVGALARGRKVVREADDGQYTSAVGDELSSVVELCAGMVNARVPAFPGFIQPGDGQPRFIFLRVTTGGRAPDSRRWP